MEALILLNIIRLLKNICKNRKTFDKCYDITSNLWYKTLYIFATIIHFSLPHRLSPTNH